MNAYMTTEGKAMLKELDALKKTLKEIQAQSKAETRVQLGFGSSSATGRMNESEKSLNATGELQVEVKALKAQLEEMQTANLNLTSRLNEYGRSRSRSRGPVSRSGSPSPRNTRDSNVKKLQSDLERAAMKIGGLEAELAAATSGGDVVKLEQQLAERLDECANKETQLSSQKEVNAVLMNEGSNMLSEVTDLKARIATLQQEKEELETKMDDDKLRELEEENASLKTEIEDSKPLLSAVADVQRANAELTAQETELLAELDLGKTELELLKKQEVEAQKALKYLNELEQTNDTLEKERTSEQDKKKAYKSQLEALQLELDQQKAEVTDINQANDVIDAERSRLELLVKELRANASAAEQVTELNSAMSLIETERDTLALKFKELKQTVSDLTSSSASGEAELKAKDLTLKDTEQNVWQLQAKLGEQEDQSKADAGNLKKLQEENAKLKAELDSSAARQTAHIAQLDLEIECLKKQHSEDEGTFNNLLTLKSKLQQEKEELEKKLKEANEEVQEAGESIVILLKKQEDKLDLHKQQAKAEKEELQDKLAELTAVGTSSFSGGNIEVEVDVSAASAQYQMEDDKLHKLRVKITLLRQELEKQDEQAKVAIANAIAKEKDEFKKHFAHAKSEAVKVTKDLQAALEKEKEEFKKHFDHAKAEALQRMTDQKATYEAELAKLRAELRKQKKTSSPATAPNTARPAREEDELDLFRITAQEEEDLKSRNLELVVSLEKLEAECKILREANAGPLKGMSNAEQLGLSADFIFGRRVYQCTVSPPGVGYRFSPVFADKVSNGNTCVDRFCLSNAFSVLISECCCRIKMAAGLKTRSVLLLMEFAKVSRVPLVLCHRYKHNCGFNG